MASDIIVNNKRYQCRSLSAPRQSSGIRLWAFSCACSTLAPFSSRYSSFNNNIINNNNNNNIINNNNISTLALSQHLDSKWARCLAWITCRKNNSEFALKPKKSILKPSSDFGVPEVASSEFVNSVNVNEAEVSSPFLTEQGTNEVSNVPKGNPVNEVANPEISLSQSSGQQSIQGVEQKQTQNENVRGETETASLLLNKVSSQPNGIVVPNLTQINNKEVDKVEKRVRRVKHSRRVHFNFDVIQRHEYDADEHEHEEEVDANEDDADDYLSAEE